MSRRFLSAGLLLGVVTLAGCDADPLLYPSPQSLEVIRAPGGAGPATGTVGEFVDPAVVFRVLDGNGNPVPGARVQASVISGAGSIGATEYRSNRQGLVVIEAWRLGEQPVANRVGLSILSHAGVDLPGGGTSVTVAEVIALPGAPSEVVRPSSAPLEGRVGSPVTPSARVLVTDRFGNPLQGVEVAFQVSVGGGSVGQPVATTNSAGIADPGPWMLGPTMGTQELVASVVDAPGVSLTLSVVAMPPWSVEGVHVNQGNQTLDGGIPLVRGRGGLLRAFFRGGTESAPGIRVRFRIRQGGTVVLDELVARTDGGGIDPSPPNTDFLSRSWNVAVPGSLIQPGAELQVVLDPDGILGLPPEFQVQWPVGGGWAPLEVVEVPDFRVTFVPMVTPYWGTTGRITPANLMDYAAETVDKFPIAGFDFTVRDAPFTFDGSFAAGSNGWSNALGAIRELRLAEGNLTRYYHGVLQRPGGPGVAGIAYVVTNPASIDFLAAVSYDILPDAGGVIAHEFGHNWGRFHAPCNVEQNPAQPFPYPQAQLGFAGYSAFHAALRPTNQYRDVMGYCRPFWTSDFTFAQVLAMRRARPVGSPPMPEPWGSLSAPNLLVGGGWSANDGAFVNAAFEVDAPPSTTSSTGAVRVEVLGADGTLLASGRYPAVPIAHAEDPTLFHFGAVVRLPAGAEPHSIRVTTPVGDVEREPAPDPRTPGALPGGLPGAAAAALAPDLRVDPVPAPSGSAQAAFAPGETAPAGWARVRWDVERHPRIMVREDGGERRVIAILESGDAVIALPAPASGVPSIQGTARLSFHLSDGVRTVRVADPRGEAP